ncbi:MAG: nuclear transport factor 2 family protein [Rhodothermia bacterium]|nr:nuclear transport factor 2 family protein [Rhodothermia bacterium]
MKHLLLLAALGGTVLLPGCGKPDSLAEDSISNQEEIVLATEDEYVAAEINRDEASLRRILDDRFVFNSNNGTTSGKEELIKNVLSWNMTGQEITERSAVVADDTAVVLGTTELRFASDDGDETTSLLRYTATYVLRQGQWRLLALHMAKRSL